MQRLLIGAWWGPRPCAPRDALQTLGGCLQDLAASPGGVPAWALLRLGWDDPERIAWKQGRWQLPPQAVARAVRDEITGAVDARFGTSVSLIEAGWTAAAGRAPGDAGAATLSATIGSMGYGAGGTAGAVPNHVLLQLCGPSQPGTAIWQPCFEVLVRTFSPDHAAVVDWTRPDPQDARPPWARDGECLARFPPAAANDGHTPAVAGSASRLALGDRASKAWHPGTPAVDPDVEAGQGRPWWRRWLRR